jgi:hypothetical protein
MGNQQLKMSYFRVRYLYLVGDDEDDGLDGALEVRCVVILAKVWDHIVFSFFCGFVYNRFRHY